MQVLKQITPIGITINGDGSSSLRFDTKEEAATFVESQDYELTEECHLLLKEDPESRDGIVTLISVVSKPVTIFWI